MTLDDKGALEHAWNYFQLHAAQRITVFNFFVATSGLLVAALVFALRGGAETATLSMAAGVGLVALSFVFWKLDGRVSAMIKVSEAVIMKIEEKCIVEADDRVMCNEQEVANRTKFQFFSSWTYGQAFRRIFIVVGAFGVFGLGLGALQFCSGLSPKVSKGTQNLVAEISTEAKAEQARSIAQSNQNSAVDPVVEKAPAK